MTTRHKNISEMLKDQRKTLDHNQSEAARIIDVSRQIYSQWESGHAIPGERFIPPISVYLEVDEEWLALQRYHEKLERDMGVSVSSISRSLVAA